VGGGVDGSHIVSVTGSVGVATSDESAGTTELQRQADLALYVAKGEGKNTWRRYQSGLHAEAAQRLELSRALSDAVTRDQLVVQFQPIIDLATEAVLGVETLVRWEHPP